MVDSGHLIILKYYNILYLILNRTAVNKYNIIDTNIEIRAGYKILWNQYYYSSEKKDSLWANGLNPRLDGLPAERERSKTTPPQVRIQLVDETGKALQEDLIISGKSCYICFSIESSDPDMPCLAAYSEPNWSKRPKDIRYSSWFDIYNSKFPAELLQIMDRFNGKSNPRFSGNLMKSGIHFYAFYNAPSVKQDEDLTVTLPFRYTYDENLAGQEEFWIKGSNSVTFTLTRGMADEDISDIVGLNVTTSNCTDQATVALVLPGGQVGRFTGRMVELVPTDHWWPGMLNDWRKRNQKMMEYDLSKKLKKGGIKQLAGDIVAAYDQRLSSGLSAVFTVSDILNAKSDEKIVSETSKVVAGILIPSEGVLLPVLEMGFIWAKREKKESSMLKELNRASPDVPFRPATVYHSASELYGTRIMYKVINETMYFIPLGKTSL